MEEEGEEERQEEAKEICGVLLPLLCASSHSHVDHTYTHTHTHPHTHTSAHTYAHSIFSFAAICSPSSSISFSPLGCFPPSPSLPLPLFHSLSPTRVFRPHTQTHASPSFAGHLLAANCAEHRATAHSNNASPAVSLSLSLSSLSLSPTFPRASEARLSPSPPYMQ